jgi:hypothetical protein
LHVLWLQQKISPAKAQRRKAKAQSKGAKGKGRRKESLLGPVKLCVFAPLREKSSAVTVRQRQVSIASGSSPGNYKEQRRSKKEQR